MSVDDPELKAMAVVRDELESLDEDVRRRVLRWAIERFGIRSGASAATSSLMATTHDYGDFASLFSSADPGSEAEKALVAAYWFQVVQGEDSLESQRLNTELKNLGHGIKNVTSALDKLMARNPKMVMQVRKAGSSRQARKSYRLTVAGVNRVIQMLEAAPGAGTDGEEA